MGRARGDTDAFGTRDASAPGRRSPVSRVTAARTVPAANPASSSQYTSRVGAGPYWMRALAPRAPAASPNAGDALLTTGAGPGDSSTRAADSAPMAVPVAAPWSTLASPRTRVESAAMKHTIAAISARSAAMM